MFWVIHVSDTPFCVVPRLRIGRCIIFTGSTSRIATTVTMESGAYTVRCTTRTAHGTYTERAMRIACTVANPYPSTVPAARTGR